MTVTASQLRQNVYQLLDRVLETGIPLTIERKGRILEIVPRQRRSKLDNLKPRPDYLLSDPEELVHLDWSDQWRP